MKRFLNKILKLEREGKDLKGYPSTKEFLDEQIEMVKGLINSEKQKQVDK